MKRSFLRLVIGSVLACWAIGFVVLYIYSHEGRLVIADSPLGGAAVATLWPTRGG